MNEEKTSLLISINTIAKKNPELVNKLANDEVLALLLENVDNKLAWLNQVYKQNVKRLDELTLLESYESEIEFCKDRMTLVSRDIFEYYNLYKLYSSIADTRERSITVDDINISESHGILIQNGLVEIEKTI